MSKKLLLLLACGAAFAFACESDETKQRCSPESKKCDGRDCMLCVDGVWQKQASCTEAQVCDVNEASGCKDKDCTGEAPKCEGRHYMVCENKAWKVEKTCEFNEICDLDEASKCKVEDCTGKAPKCESTKPYCETDDSGFGSEIYYIECRGGKLNAEECKRACDPLSGCVD